MTLTPEIHSSVGQVGSRKPLRFRVRSGLRVKGSGAWDVSDRISGWVRLWACPSP